MSDTKTTLKHVDVQRNCEKINYIGRVYSDHLEYCNLIRERIPACADMKDTEILDNIVQSYQSGKHIHQAQRLFKKDKLAKGMLVEYVRIGGLRASKWGPLSSYVDAAKAQLKSMDVEVNDDNIRKLAQHMHDEAEKRKDEFAALFAKDDETADDDKEERKAKKTKVLADIKRHAEENAEIYSEETEAD